MPVQGHQRFRGKGRMLALVLLCAPVLAEDLPGVVDLLPGTAVEDRLTADGVHVYRAELGAGAWRLVLEQHGGDAEVTLVRPGGERLGPFNSPTGGRGPEAVLLTLDAAGTVVVEIRPRTRSSVGLYQVAVERLADSVTPAESSATAAGRHYAAGEKAEARELYREALSRWPPGEVAGRARTLTALAVLAGSADEPREAAELYREALPLWRSLEDREAEATVLNRLGLTLDRLGESADARRLFEQALVLWREIGDRPGEALQRNNLCLALQRQGELAGARTCYEEARALFRELGDPDRERVVLSNLAGVYWKLGEPNRALELYDRVLEHCRSHGDDLQLARTLSNRGLLEDELGEAEQALLHYDEALSVFRRLGNRRMEAAVLSNLGGTYLGLGELERARSYLEEALPLRRAVGDPRGEATTLRHLGETYFLLEDRSLAYETYGKALALSRELKDRRGEATVLQRIGEAHAADAASQRAAAELAGALELQREIGDRRQEGQALLALGKLQRRTGRPEQALERIREALSIFRNLRDRAEEVRALEEKARLERDRGHVAEALADTAAAVELLEDLRVRAGGLRQRAAFFATRRGVYELRVDLLMELHASEPGAGHDREALALAERARSRALLDVLGPVAGLDDGLRQRLRRATRRLAGRVERQVTVLGAEHTTDDAAAAEREVYDALSELERLRAEARRQSPAYSELTRAEPLSAGEIRGLLDPGTLLLEILLGEERGFLWAVAPDSVSAFELPPRREVEALARRAHDDLGTLDLRTGQTDREALRQLARLLLGPVADRLAGAQRLAVVADGALHYLPFAAFPRPGGDEPLLESHEVVHLPSASALAAQRRRTPHAPAAKTLAILADPVFNPRDPRLAGGAAAGEKADPGSGGTLSRWAPAFGDLVRLPATGREAEAVAALTAPRQRLVALGFEANRDRVVRGGLTGYRYLHFATHGLVSSSHPDLAGIVLSLYDEEGRRRGGFLSLDDVYGLRLDADLVVLSGCRTALGKEIRGEGLLGLARGFMAAGVPRVVASLWSVQDRSTAALMPRFYRGMLAEGQTPAAALAAAQRSIRRERRWEDPHFWAAFLLEGDWR